MLQNLCKTLGFKKNMVYKIPPGGGGKPYPASGLLVSVAEATSLSLVLDRFFRDEAHFFTYCILTFMRVSLFDLASGYYGFVL